MTNSTDSHASSAGSRRREVAGSDHLPIPGATPTGKLDNDQTVTVTIQLRRRAAMPLPSQVKRRMAREELTRQYGAHPDDIALVERFAAEHNLRVVAEEPEKRNVLLRGTAGDCVRAFEARLEDVVLEGKTVRQRTGVVTVPEYLAPAVVDVRGLDNRPIARPHFRMAGLKGTEARKSATAVSPVSPVDVAQRYNFPAGDGAGSTIAIIELGGGFSSADLQAYFQSLNLPPPSVTAVPSGAQNVPGGSADGEVMLDIEVAGAIAPKASILVYFAPNTNQGFIGAVQSALHDAPKPPTVISISWGGPENSWPASSMSAFDEVFKEAANLGTPVFVAAGDSGSSDGETGLHVDFPASAPHAIGCGGTDLLASSEVVWNGGKSAGAGGGGVSSVFTKPTYQSSVNVPAAPTSVGGRGVPDVTGCGGDLSPYKVRVDGKNTEVWGTSAVAPLWSGLLARTASQIGPFTWLTPLLYAAASEGFNDITSGNNNLTGHGQYQAAAGWDCCGGLGSPKGVALIHALHAATAQVMQAPGGMVPAVT
ncbi:MAG TPA: S53 family peptidase [Opitutaceae bacterium]|jgi:kumamolisin